MNRTAAIIVIALALSTGAQAEPTDVQKLAANNVSHQFIDCAAFFAFTAMCLGNQDPPLKARAERQRKDYINLAFGTATAAGLKPEIVVARYKTAFDKLQKHTDCLNVSILRERHLVQCEALIEVPQRLKRH